MKNTMSVPQIINGQVCDNARVANLINWYRAHNSNIEVINNTFGCKEPILGIVQLDCLELVGMAFEDIVKIQCDCIDKPMKKLSKRGSYEIITLWDKNGKSASFEANINIFRLCWWWGYL